LAERAVGVLFIARNTQLNMCDVGGPVKNCLCMEEAFVIM
jgi:hypothetical protein